MVQCFAKSYKDESIYPTIDDSRSKILDSDLLAALLSKLGDNDPDVCRSAVECIRTLARHGTLLQHSTEKVIVLMSQ